MSELQYVPLLKGKANDIAAFSQLSAYQRSHLKPLFDLPFFGKDQDPEEHIGKFVDRIVSTVHLDQACFVDFYPLEDYLAAESGQLAIVEGFELLEKHNRHVTPVLGVGRDAGVFEAVRPTVNRVKQGVCLRVDVETIDGQADQVVLDVGNRLTLLGMSRGSCDLLLDIRAVRRLQFSVVDAVLDFLAVLGQGDTFRSIILAGSSALTDVSSVPMDGFLHVERSELKLWDRVVFELAGSMVPVFGDYGVVNPEFFAEGARPNANAKIRYTNGLRTTYFRGHGLHSPVTDFQQYRSLASSVKAQPYYDGPAFSFGDAYIAKVAAAPGPKGFGNLGPWVRADTNRHLSVVAAQMQTRANLILAARSIDEALVLPG